MAKGDVELSLRILNGSSALEKGLDRLNNKIIKALNKSYKKTFGKQTDIQDWIGAKSKSTRERLRRGLSTTYESNPANEKLKALYVKAWKAKYRKIISDYRSASPDYKSKSWYAYKKRNKGKARPAHANRQIKFVGWGLTTGFFRDSITKSFERGGSEYLKIGSLMLQGGFELNFDSYQKDSSGNSRYLMFVNLLQRSGAIEDQDSLFDFLPSDVNRIASQMRLTIETGFNEDAQTFLRQIREKI